MSEPSDVELVLALKGAADGASFDQAFCELVRRFERRVRAYCLLRLRSAELARDVAQEVFIAFFKNLPRYEPRASLSTYLIGIARNLCSQQLRSAKARLSRELRSSDGRTNEAKDPAELVDRAEQAVEVARALGELPGELRETVELRVFAGLSFQEIGEVLGRPRSTVQDWFAEALHALRRALGGP